MAMTDEWPIPNTQVKFHLPIQLQRCDQYGLLASCFYRYDVEKIMVKKKGQKVSFA